MLVPPCPVPGQLLEPTPWVLGLTVFETSTRLRRHARFRSQTFRAPSVSGTFRLKLGAKTLTAWLRFVLDGTSNSSFITFTQSHTGALTYLREGLRQIAGSTEPGPPALPESGTVRYRGTTYGVTSFIAQTPAKPTRVPVHIYQLVAL